MVYELESLLSSIISDNKALLERGEIPSEEDTYA